MKIQVFVKAEYHPTMTAQLKAGNKVLEEINSFLPQGKLEMKFDHKDKDLMYLPLMNIEVNRGLAETITAAIKTVFTVIGSDDILFKFDELSSDWQEGIPDDHREVLCMLEDGYVVCRHQSQGWFAEGELESRKVLKWKQII